MRDKRSIRQVCLSFREDKRSNKGKGRMRNVIKRGSCWLRMRVRKFRGCGRRAMIRVSCYLHKAITKHFLSIISNTATITTTSYNPNHNYKHSRDNQRCRPSSSPHGHNPGLNRSSTSYPQTRNLQLKNNSHHQIHCKNNLLRKVITHTKISQVRISKISRLMNVTESYTRIFLST